MAGGNMLSNWEEIIICVVNGLFCGWWLAGAAAGAAATTCTAVAPCHNASESSIAGMGAAIGAAREDDGDENGASRAAEAGARRSACGSAAR